MAKKNSQSQLTRLKSALRDSGISRQPQERKGPRKSRLNKEKDLLKIREKFNPYDTQINKSKFSIGGRKVKGDMGRPGAAASAAERMRQETLGAEKKRRGRTGGLIDRRFGEGRADLTPEQVQLERYTRERQRGKKHNFSLEDQDDLTHMGQSLNDMDDFGPAPMSDDEDMGAEMVSRTNFGGFVDDQDLEENEIIDEETGIKRKKTKAEIMHEIIAKSKASKYERQKQADEDEDAREALDNELEELQMMLSTSEAMKPKKQDGLSDARFKALQEDSEYDKAVKELIYDRRAQATDRTKTEEELVEEEAKKLHEQEEARMKRMRGEEVEEEPGGRHGKKRRRRDARGDDLSDDFVSDDEDSESGEEEFGVGVNASSSAHVEFENDDRSEEGTPDEDEVDEEESQDSDEDHIQDEEEDKFNKVTFSNQGKVIPASIKNDPTELKFTYGCPSSLKELLAITNPLSEPDILVALHRIRVLHHPRLNAQNNEKLSTFLIILIDYSLLPDVFKSVLEFVLNLIWDLSQKYWESSVGHFIEIMEEIRQATYAHMGKAWGRREILFFRLVGRVWSTSDAYHKVATPAQLLMAQYLAQSTSKDNTSKLMICHIFMEYQNKSKRYMPEVVKALRQVLEARKADLEIQEADLNSGVTPLTFSDVESSTVVTRISQQKVAEELVVRLAHMYISSVSFAEVFAPLISLLSIEKQVTLQKASANNLQSRKSLTLQAHRPIALASYIPKFEENFSLDKKSYDKDNDRARDSKLKAEYRNAKRGAVRVLRRDAQFEARESAKDRRSQGALYKKKMGKIENGLKQGDQ